MRPLIALVTRLDMKLTFVIGDISACGGTERVTIEIARELAQSGHEVSILSLFGPAKPWFSVPSTILVRSTNLEPAKGSLRRSLAISRCLEYEACEPSLDAMILVDTILFAFCVPWLWRSSIKIICWEHFNLSTSHGTPMRNVARFLASRLSDKVVVLTERDAETWRRSFKITSRVQAVSNPIPLFPQYDLTGVRPSQNDLIVLAVGRLTHQKGFDLLLRAWAALDCSTRKGWILRIVGSGEEAATLKALAVELHIDGSIVFVGHLRDVACEYLNASLYVMSSRWEGLPMSLLEAQHFGLPCVSFDCPTGPREVLANESGLLASPENPATLAHSLSDLMRHPAKRAKLAAAALSNSKRYGLPVIVEEWRQLLSDTLG